uniref:Uncharacterized protein n=1 Tax=viral metagenome TaxID=1070528 RepID=A0A6C0LRY7_9ZZZZ
MLIRNGFWFSKLKVYRKLSFISNRHNFSIIKNNDDNWIIC